MTEATFLGTGNFLANGRYWNSFVLDRSLLVEPSPTAMPHLRRCGLAAADLDVVAISHFHADHTFGWPFLLLELLRHHDERPVHVVGPPGLRDFLHGMTDTAGIPDVQQAADERLDLRYVEVHGRWQQAGPLRFRAVEVEHVPHLQCYGYVFDLGSKTVGYSGDTRLCAGLEEITGAVDVMILECNGGHPWPTHMDTGSVAVLRERFPTVPFVLTHLGEDVDASGIKGVTVPEDLQTLTL
jgi:ribonuclease Z